MYRPKIHKKLSQNQAGPKVIALFAAKNRRLAKLERRKKEGVICFAIKCGFKCIFIGSNARSVATRNSTHWLTLKWKAKNVIGLMSVINAGANNQNR